MIDPEISRWANWLVKWPVDRSIDAVLAVLLLKKRNKATDLPSTVAPQYVFPWSLSCALLA